MMNTSPAAVAQRKLADRMHISPRQTAQRQLINRIHHRQAIQKKKSWKLLAPMQRLEQKEKSQSTAKPNNTRLPDRLKSGIENLSGLSMDHVTVHYNSSQSAQLNALAYAQGSDLCCAGAGTAFAARSLARDTTSAGASSAHKADERRGCA